jgi:hypothetical protein
MTLILEIALGVTLGLALFYSLLTYGKDLLALLLRVLLYLVVAMFIPGVFLLGCFYVILHPNKVAPHLHAVLWGAGLFLLASLIYTFISDRRNLKRKRAEETNIPA